MNSKTEVQRIAHFDHGIPEKHHQTQNDGNRTAHLFQGKLSIIHENSALLIISRG